jgi:hypothetical protein
LKRRRWSSGGRKTYMVIVIWYKQKETTERKRYCRGYSWVMVEDKELWKFSISSSATLSLSLTSLLHHTHTHAHTIFIELINNKGQFFSWLYNTKRLASSLGHVWLHEVKVDFDSLKKKVSLCWEKRHCEIKDTKLIIFILVLL